MKIQLKSKEKETKLELFVFDQNISFIRKTILVCVLLYSLFGTLDYVLYPEHIVVFYIIRFGIVVPYLLLLFGLSYTKNFAKYYQVLLILLYFLAGAGIIFMTYIIGGDNYYTNGLFLVFAIGFYLIRLRLKNSLIAFFLIIMFFVIIEYTIGTMTTEEILVNSFFYVTFAVIGIFGGFFNDRFINSQYQNEKEFILERGLLEKQINQQLIKINTQLEDINQAHVEMIYALAQLAESRDALTAGHLRRVGDLSYLLAENIPSELYLENDSSKEVILESIKLSSILHDIGKITISDKILNKKGKLTKAEFDTMKTHSVVGASTLKSIGMESLKKDFVVMGTNIAKFHHEKWDGSGYPTGIKGKEIPFGARIVAVIDVFDALMSVRPYKNKFSLENSLKIIKEGSGSHFDPELVEIFLELALEHKGEELFK